MEVLPDGNYEPYPDHVKISFERCDELPTIDPLENNNLETVLSAFMEYPITELIPKSTVKQSRRNTTCNTTFKHRRGKGNSYSRKSISLEIADDLQNSLKPVQGELVLDDHICVNSSLI